MKKTKFALPKTTAQATKVAGTLTNEATEKEFSLSALVFAQVLPHGKRVDPDSNNRIQRVTCNQFSQRGIRGLTTADTVIKYRNTWQALIDAGHVVSVSLGDIAEWPADLEWADWYPGDNRDGTPERHVAKADLAPTPAAVHKAIKEDPKIAKEARLALVERNAEAAERAATKAKVELVEEGFAPMEADDEDSESPRESRLGYAVEEAERRDYVWEIAEEAEALHDKISEMVEKFGHTGVPDEVEKLQSAVHHLTEGAFGLNDFIVENAEVSK